MGKKILKFFLKLLLCLVLIVLVAGGAYYLYLTKSYHRIGDGGELNPNRYGKNASAEAETDYKIVSWNIGFGAYEDDYGFFMDGGTQSWAWSAERLKANLKAMGEKLQEQAADFYFIQEVDYSSTRTYKVDEITYMTNALPKMSYTFAQNYDSPFLLYPFNQPHGANKAGIMTFSKFNIASGTRRELPIEDSLMKFLDLDRCYSVNRIPGPDGKQLVLYNFHLSAYTSDGTIATEQLVMILKDMQAEYEKGNYCIAGGDFNKDILGDSSQYFGKADKEYSWAKPIPEGTLNGYNVKLIAPLDEANPVPSCRNADGPYHKGQYVLTIDGFLVSDNVEVKESNVIDFQFKYSDHNPVYMNFALKKAAAPEQP